MLSERELQISPLVNDSIIHNTKTLSNLHNLTASLFGIAAGILGLESYPGFLFYLFFSMLTNILIYIFHVLPESTIAGTKAKPGDTSLFVRSAFAFWSGGVVEGLSGFVLTWTLFYGLVRA